MIKWTNNLGHSLELSFLGYAHPNSASFSDKNWLTLRIDVENEDGSWSKTDCSFTTINLITFKLWLEATAFGEPEVDTFIDADACFWMQEITSYRDEITFAVTLKGKLSNLEKPTILLLSISEDDIRNSILYLEQLAKTLKPIGIKYEQLAQRLLLQSDYANEKQKAIDEGLLNNHCKKLEKVLISGSTITSISKTKDELTLSIKHDNNNIFKVKCNNFLGDAYFGISSSEALVIRSINVQDSNDFLKHCVQIQTKNVTDKKMPFYVVLWICLTHNETIWIVASDFEIVL